MKITDLLVPFADELQLAPTPRVANPPLIEWASAWGDLFFRPQAADPQIVWCVLGRGAPAKRPLSKQRLATLNKYVSGAYAGRTFFRVVPFSDDDDWALVRPKRALVKSPTQKKGAIWQWSANFAAPQGQIEWMSQPHSWFDNWLRDNADEQLQAARAFARLNDDERKWLVITRDVPTPQKWETLMPALQKLGFAALDKYSMTWHLYGHLINSTPIYPLYQISSRPDIKPIIELTQVLQDRHPLDYQRQMWRGIGIRGKRANNKVPVYKAAEPTQHEKLEAALLWRDFAREIGESQRVEAALNQLLALESSD